MDARGIIADEDEARRVALSRSALRARDFSGVPRRHREFAAWMVALSFAGDCVAVVGGLLLAFILRYHTPLRHVGHHGPQVMDIGQYRGHFIFLSVTLLIALFHFGLYGAGRPQRLRRTYAIVLTGCGLWFLGNLGLSFELNMQPIVSRLFLACAFGCTLGALTFWHRALDALLNLRPVAALLRRRILFVGWSEQSQRLLAQIDADRKHPYQVVGCVPSPGGKYDREPAGSVTALGSHGELQTLLAEHAIDLVIVADLNPTRGALLDLVNTCEREMVHLQVIPSCFQVLLAGLHLETTSGVPVLGISRLPLDSAWNQLLKRLIDITGALAGLAVCSPLLAVVAALVYLESPGRVFYRQSRMGRGGKRFRVVRVRRMPFGPSAPDRTGSGGGSARPLRVSRLIRLLAIDEVPLFWNVLRGEMSLVGPDPERPELIEELKHQIPHYNARHGIKPGITGWAQVNGLRGDTHLVERIKCDLYYIENWNLLLEFQILLTTFFRGTAAG